MLGESGYDVKADTHVLKAQRLPAISTVRCVAGWQQEEGIQLPAAP